MEEDGGDGVRTIKENDTCTETQKNRLIHTVIFEHTGADRQRQRDRNKEVDMHVGGSAGRRRHR